MTRTLRVTILLLLTTTIVFGSTAVLGQDSDTLPEPTQNPSAQYRMFRTKNIYTLLKLDTRSGLVWQVQWGESKDRVVLPINVNPRVTNGELGRFTLYPTNNIYTFILLDQQDGRVWQVQWSWDHDRFIAPIE